MRTEKKFNFTILQLIFILFYGIASLFFLSQIFSNGFVAIAVSSLTIFPVIALILDVQKRMPYFIKYIGNITSTLSIILCAVLILISIFTKQPVLFAVAVVLFAIPAAVTLKYYTTFKFKGSSAKTETSNSKVEENIIKETYVPEDIVLDEPKDIVSEEVTPTRNFAKYKNKKTILTAILAVIVLIGSISFLSKFVNAKATCFLENIVLKSVTKSSYTHKIEFSYEGSAGGGDFFTGTTAVLKKDGETYLSDIKITRGNKTNSIEVDDLINGNYELEITGFNYNVDKLTDRKKSKLLAANELYTTKSASFSISDSFNTAEEIAASKAEEKARKLEQQKQEQAARDAEYKQEQDAKKAAETLNYQYAGFEITNKSSDGDFVYVTIKNTYDYPRSYVRVYANIYKDEACTSLITQAHTAEKTIGANSTVTLSLPILTNIDSQFWFTIDRITASN